MGFIVNLLQRSSAFALLVAVGIDAVRISSNGDGHQVVHGLEIKNDDGHQVLITKFEISSFEDVHFSMFSHIRRSKKSSI